MENENETFNENPNQDFINVPETQNEPISFNQDDELLKEKNGIVSDREEIYVKNEPGIETTVNSNVEVENENENLSQLLNSNSDQVNEHLNTEENNSYLYIQEKVDSDNEEVSASITSTVEYQEKDSQDLVSENKLQATDRENKNPETDLQNNTYLSDDISDKVLDIYTTEMKNLDLQDKTNYQETVDQTEGQAKDTFTPNLVDSPFKDVETDKINVRRNNKLKLKIDSKNIKLNSPDNIDFTDYEYGKKIC